MRTVSRSLGLHPNMPFDPINISSADRYALIGKLMEEVKLRKYSYKTGKLYISMVQRRLPGPG